MVSNADILVNFQGVDNVSSVAQQMQGNMQGSANSMQEGMSGVNQSTGGLMNSISRLGNIFSGLNGLVMGTFGAYGLGRFKDMTYGLSVAREEAKGLFETVAGNGPGANKLWADMDELTNHGYVALDDLTQAVNVFGMSTGTGLEGMQASYELINDIGNRAIQMGYDGNRQLQLMQSVGQGLNGQMRMLNVAFGVSKDKLKDLGWSGSSKDVQGYVNALKEYLTTNADMGDLLNSTQGKVVSLQKKLRIVGRQLGDSYVKPFISSLLDAFTNLNAESDDLLAKILIISTGAMSGFASILPTLSPLIQLYQFLGDEMGNINRTLGMFSLKGMRNDIRMLRGGVSSVVSPFRQLIGVTNDWIGSPLLGYLRENNRLFNAMSKISIADGFSKFSSVLNNSIGKNIKYNSTIMSMRKSLRFMLTDSNGLVGKASGFVGENVIGKGSKKILDFAKNYGSLTSKMRVATVTSNLFKLSNVELLKATELENIEGLKSLGLKTEGALASIFSAEANTMEGLAKAGTNEQMAIQNGLRLYEMGLINDEQLARLLATVGIVDETVARELDTMATVEEAGAKGFLGTVLEWVTALEWASILPLLLIVGAIIGVILVIKELGKSLGWWEDWGEMLSAIQTGLQRLWSAFINNPNVQGFIKDLQWIWGQLGGAIGSVGGMLLDFFGIEDNGEQFDFVRLVIDTFGALGDMLGKIVNALKWAESEFHIFSTIFNIITAPIQAIVWVLRTIICALLGCSPGIVPALKKVQEVFGTVFGAIVSFITNPVGFIVGQFKQLISGAMQIGDMIGGFLIDRFNKFLDFLGPLGTAIRNVFNGALPVLANIVQKVANTIGQVFGVFSGMLTGKIGIEEGLNRLSQIILPLLIRIYQIFVGIFNRIRTYIIKTAMSMVNGFIGYILSIPRRVMSIFTNLLNMLFNLPSQIWNTGKQMGQDIYNGIDSAVSGLTGGMIHLPGNTNGQQGQARANARTVGNVNKNYNNARRNTGHTINVGAGAIQLDARNLTTKESRQVMINALEGLTSIARTKATNPKK